jgi:hypothetical protein
VISAAEAAFLLSSAASHSLLQLVVDQQFWGPILQLQQIGWGAFRHVALVEEDSLESHAIALVCIPTIPNVLSIPKIRPILPQAPARRSAC